MSFRYFNRARGSGAVRAFDSDALAWEAAVATNGGTVSLNQRILVDQLIYSLKSAGCWPLMDDAWLLVAENPQQALTSLKQKRLAVAFNSPVFTADRGFTTDGVSSYIDTGFIVSSHASAASTNSARIEIYERVQLSQNTYAIGATGTANHNWHLRPRLSATIAGGNTNSNGTQFTLAVQDSRGLFAASRVGPTVNDMAAYKNGAALSMASPATGVGADLTLPNISIFVGGYNNAGVLTTPRANTYGWASVGAAMSAGQELAHYNAIQAYMTAKGANV